MHEQHIKDMHKLYMIFRDISQFLFCVQESVCHTCSLAGEKFSPAEASLVIQRDGQVLVAFS